MKDSTKKWLTITGGLVICAILVFVIAQQFTKEKATDALPPTSSSQQDEVVVDPDSSNPTTDPDASSDISEDDLTINPQTSPNDTGTNAGNGAISSGTEQTIQADPEVPEKPDEETLTDPSQKPDGTPVEGTPTPEDHDNYQPPQQPSTNTGGGLPGFENVPTAGGNQGGTIDSDGDINKQVGTMG
ncbi:MAG: hypothetical protein KH050_08185 [Clostridiaceae bacterium]|jgi:hypothetical protein|nr:hypothetical protein [Clostridiaceae bacterium]